MKVRNRHQRRPVYRITRTRARPLFERHGTGNAPAALDLTAAGNYIELRAARRFAGRLGRSGITLTHQSRGLCV
jgi:uncharacterized protein (DUF3084 family)